MATQPPPPQTQVDAWNALLEHADVLDSIRHPKELKEKMHNFLARRIDMAESKIDFVDFGIVWIDTHYRHLTTKMAAIGPGRETFAIATYRILKSSRLEGYWDTILENVADWVASFAADYLSQVSLNDFDRILATMPQGRDPNLYKTNLAHLFWGPSGNTGDTRTPGFLRQLPLIAYDDAYNVLKDNPPDAGWELRELMYQIQHRGILCKSVMLHVGLWFNPDLEEPANRSNAKFPMFHHLKLAFSNFDPSHPSYETDETWKPRAIALQRIILNYTLEQWPKGHLLIGKLGTLQDMSFKEYGDYIATPFWEGLIREIRRNTDVPFRHKSLQQYNGTDRSIHAAPAWTAVPRNSAIMDQVNNIIREEYGEDDTVELSADDNSSDDADGATRRQWDNDKGRRISSQSDKALDVIVVEENGGQSRKRKAPRMKQEFEEENFTSSQNKRRTPSSGIFEQEQTKTSTNKRTTGHRASLPLHMMQQEPIQMNTIVSSARAALASMQPMPHSEPKRSGFRSASSVLPTQTQEGSPLDADEDDLTPSRRLRKHDIPPAVGHQPLPPLPQFPPQHQLDQRHFENSQPSQPLPDTISQTPQMTESPGPSGRDRIEQAIVVLQEQYGDKMQIKEMLAAIKLLKNEVEATIFLTLKPGRLRNAWLQNEIR